MTDVVESDAKRASDMIDSKVSMTNTDSDGANMETIEVDSPYIAEIDACVMDERHRNLMKTKMMISCLFRRLYDITFANKWGHFTDNAMTQLIHQYGYWVRYQTGNGRIDVDYGRIACIVASKDECYLYSGTLEGHITQFSLMNNTEIRRWSIDRSTIECLASLNGYVISGGSDCLIHIWSPMSHRSLAGHTASVDSLDVIMDGKMIVSGSEDNTVRVWCLNTGLLLKQWNNHSFLAKSNLSCIGNSIISGSFNDTTIKVLTDTTEKASVSVGRGRIRYLASNSSFIACLLRYEIVIMKWPELKEIRRISNSAKYAAFHPFKHNLLVIPDRLNYSVHILDVMNDSDMELVYQSDSHISAIDFSYDGNRIIFTTYNHIQFIDMSDRDWMAD